MKKIFMTAVMAGLYSVLPLQAAFDGTIGVTTSAGRSGSGGPFTIQIMSSSSSALNQAIALGNSFLSFCIEQSETINLDGNQGYRVNVAIAAVGGGVGGGNPDPISLATAWLYSQFRAGSLAANVAGFVDNAVGRNALQQAFWYLENEQSTGDNYLATAAALATGSANAAAARSVHANGAFNVAVLNVYSSNGLNKLQDQLVLVPEPSTYLAGALLLIPVLIQIRRWKRSA